MHVILEGVLPLELKLLLEHLTSIGIITVAHLNARISSFQYGSQSKPSAIDISHLSLQGKLRQSGKSARSLLLCVLQFLHSIAMLDIRKIPSFIDR